MVGSLALSSGCDVLRLPDKIFVQQKEAAPFGSCGDAMPSGNEADCMIGAQQGPHSHPTVKLVSFKFYVLAIALHSTYIVFTTTHLLY